MSAARPLRPFVPRPGAVAIPPRAIPFSLLPPYVHGRAVSSHATAPHAEPVETPPISRFVDDLPSIDDFAPTPAAAAAEGDWPSWGGESSASANTPSQSSATDWQQFDWASAAQLGNAPPDAAAEAWASTDWGEPEGSSTARQSAAEALAKALDQISRRIRAGELRLPGSETVQDDAAIAATLAALLGIRR